MKDEQTRAIMIKSGVRQGYPLSPFLFNLIMDELLVELQGSDLGPSLGGSRVPALAFADDLTVMADNEAEMNEILRICEKFFDARGMSANAKKCQSMKLLPAKGKNVLSCTTTPHRYWKGVAMASLTYKDLVKYLGVHLDPRGQVQINLTDIEAEMVNLLKSDLRMFQKADAIRSNLIPWWLHKLRLSDLPVTKMRKVDNLVKKYYKRILHLPEWTSDAWLHHPRGGRLINITMLIAKSKADSATSMAICGDPAANEVGQEILDEMMLYRRRCGVEEVELSETRKYYIKQCLEKVRKEKPNGVARACMLESARDRKWLWYGQTTGTELITTMLLMAGQLPCRTNLARGNPAQLKICRRCSQSNEYEMHILQECSFGKQLRQRRHNVIVKAVAKDLRTKGWTVEEEKWIRHEGENFKPDLIFWRGQVGYIADVQIPYEKNKMTLEDRMNKKAEKYEEKLWSTRMPTTVTDRKALGLIIGTTGTVMECNTQPFRELRLLSKLDGYCRMAAQGSAAIWRCHHRGR